MSEMKTLTLNGKTYDSFVDKEAREIIENLEIPEGGTVTDEQIASAVEDYIAEHPIHEGAVLYTEQTLTEGQQAQVRENIGAISIEEVDVDIEKAVVKYLTENPVKDGMTKTEKKIILTLFENTAYTSDTMSEFFAKLKSLWDEEEEDPWNEAAYLVNAGITKLDDGTLAIGQTVNNKRIAVYSALLNEKVFAEHNGSYWSHGTHSLMKIPVGAAYANVVIPSEMRYGAFIAKPHDTNVYYTTAIVDSGWITDGHATDVSSYNDGSYYFAANIAYTSNADIPANFDTSVLDIYFVDANGNRMRGD